MSDWPHLPNAPITEALIDIRVELPPGTTVATLKGFRDRLGEAYPQCRERRHWSGQFKLSKSEPLKVEAGTEEVDGFLLTSPDGTQVAQARKDGFTFSRLKPYKNWSHLREEAKALWGDYCEVAQPSRVTRIAVRYINRLELPIPVGDFRQWLKTVPDVAPDLPQRLAGFFLKLHIPFEDPKGYVNIIQTMEAGGDEESVPLVFDIDAFVPVDYKPEDGQIWKRLEDLRAIKNRVFFGSITDKLKERFQ